MAAKKKGGKAGGDVIKLTDADYKRKQFKTAPGGTYTVRLTKKSTIAPGTNGNVLKLHGQITKGPHKGVTFFDNIAPHVGWKIAQLLVFLGVKKMSLTLQALLKLVKSHDGEGRVQLREKKFKGKRRNEVVMYLPPGKSTDDDDEDQDDDADDVSDEEEDEDQDETDDESDESDDDEDSEDEDEEEESDDEESDDDEDSDDEDDDEDDDADEGDDDVEEDDDDADDDEEDGDDDEEADDEDEEDDEAPAPKRRAVAKKKAAPKRRAPAKKKTAPRRKK